MAPLPPRPKDSVEEKKREEYLSEALLNKLGKESLNFPEKYDEK
jgi:hypothetical protein